MPIGTLTRKIERQPEPAMSRWISSPPMSWPEAAATPMTVA